MNEEKIREAWKYAHSYLLPLWRLILFSDASNYEYYKKQVEKRLKGKMYDNEIK